jgi:hypothetical protein
MAYDEMAAQGARRRLHARNAAKQRGRHGSAAVDRRTPICSEAVALNPQVSRRLTCAMIEAGGLSLGDVYLASAKKHALANNPADLSIYGYLLWQAQPKWGGSIKEMRDITAMAQAHAAENPC